MAGQHRLREETADGEHRKAAVGELLHLQLLFLRRVSGETKRVKTYGRDMGACPNSDLTKVSQPLGSIQTGEGEMGSGVNLCRLP